jgi:hypothetical protein
MTGRFREFSAGSENSENTRREKGSPRQLSDAAILCARGIFMDENVIFDKGTLNGLIL